MLFLVLNVAGVIVSQANVLTPDPFIFHINEQSGQQRTVFYSDTITKKESSDQKNQDDELEQAMKEREKMKNEDTSTQDKNFEVFMDNLEVAFNDIELPDSADWDRAHQNLKDAVQHLKFESEDFKEEIGKAKIEMNKAIKRMQNQLREFNEDELQDMKKELQKALDEIKKPEEPENPVLHKLDTIKL